MLESPTESITSSVLVCTKPRNGVWALVSHFYCVHVRKKQEWAIWCMWEQNMEQYSQYAAVDHWQGGTLLGNAGSKELDSEWFVLVTFSCKCSLFGCGEQHAKKVAPGHPLGNLSEGSYSIMEGVLASGPITVPAGCPPLCKAALWTHGTWPPCCGSCSRRIRCRSARESRPALRGNCRHNQKRVWQDILHHGRSTAVIADIDCSWHGVSVRHGVGVFTAFKPRSDAHPLKLCSSIFSPRNSRNSTKAGLSSLFPNSSSSKVCSQEKKKKQTSCWMKMILTALGKNHYI